jgi:hypothetical protein
MDFEAFLVKKNTKVNKLVNGYINSVVSGVPVQ